MKNIIVLLLATLPCMAACKKSSTDNPGSSSNGNNSGYGKGYVSGIVTDTKGKPLANATIVINNTTWFNKNIVLYSDANGKYKYKMPATDSWYVRGTVTVTYTNKTYTLDLHPDYAGSFTGEEGKVINLQWKLSGEVPKDFGHDGFYGGSVEIDAGYNMSDLKDVTVTLTPSGHLIDGSTGQVITKTITDYSGSYAIRDIPIGHYQVTVKKGNQPMYITFRNTSNAVLSPVTTDFVPAYNGATAYGIYFRCSMEQ